MASQGNIFARMSARRALSLLACAALLYFACGGALLHQHTNGSETPCHVCQALHMPALASARLAFTVAPAQVAWLFLLPQHAVPNDSFSLHRPSRAPPVA
jgi:disulfide bond formation protein DsbB